MWFEQLKGFKEESPEKVINNLKVDGDCFIPSRLNNIRLPNNFFIRNYLTFTKTSKQ